MANEYVVQKRDEFEDKTFFVYDNPPLKCRLTGHYNLHDFRLCKVVTPNDNFLLITLASADRFNPSFIEKSRVIIRIDDSENIELQRPYWSREDFFDSCKYDRDRNQGIFRAKENYVRFSEYFEYKITENELRKICDANVVKIKLGDRVCEFGDVLLNYCRVFYNGAYDSTMYQDAVSLWGTRIQSQIQKEKEKRDEYARKKEEVASKEYIKTIAIIVGVIFLLVWSCCS